MSICDKISEGDKMKYFLGIDIGGTKCAICLGTKESTPKILDKLKFDTVVSRGYVEIIDEIIDSCKAVLSKNKLSNEDVLACGISCGGPLDSKRGIIMSPPNLPDWDNVPITEIISNELEIPCVLRNDADACALAEWKFGAGVGSKNMIFLTFGTGMGAGLILNSQLYSGTSGTAGEVGHIRLTDEGPLGHGKQGSFEGYCSGGGIQNLATEMFENYNGKTTLAKISLTAKNIAVAANNGDEFAISVYNKCGEILGLGLSVLIDILNPEKIVIGSIFQRSGNLLIESMQKVINEQTLEINRNTCKIVSAKLGDEIGDFAAICVAMDFWENKND